MYILDINVLHISTCHNKFLYIVTHYYAYTIHTILRTSYCGQCVTINFTILLLDVCMRYVYNIAGKIHLALTPTHIMQVSLLYAHPRKYKCKNTPFLIHGRGNNKTNDKPHYILYTVVRYLPLWYAYCLHIQSPTTQVVTALCVYRL